MQKFSEFKYTRPDCAALTAQYVEMKKQAENAKSADELCELLKKSDELDAEFYSDYSIASIRNSIDTRDEFYNDEVEYLMENSPATSEAQSDFMRAVLASPYCAEVEKRFPKVMFTNARMAVKTSSPETVELSAKESALVHEYQKLCASAKIDFMGETLTVAQLGPHKIHPDRAHRRAAFCAEGEFYMSHADELNRIFDDLVKVRAEMAHKLGYKNFTELGYLRLTRNCYDEKMVEVFRSEVKKYIVPLVAELKKKQAQRIGVDSLKFYDDGVTFKDGNPKPIGSYDDTRAAGVNLYKNMKPITAEYIDFMDKCDLFSLIATEGKAPGGYCTSIPRYKAPFIFSNFNGTAGDVEVFTHEGGHAFADYVAERAGYPLSVQGPTMESCECHSMSMEFLAWPWLESFYGERTKEAKLAHLQNSLFFIPYGCMVDEFQHIVYNNPELTPEQRHEEWLKLEAEYRPYLDMDNLPFYSDGHGWQRQLHIYHNPFYYIDYCLAQSVSLEIFALSQKDWEDAWTHYYAFLEKAGTLTFVELLEQAGLSNPFKPGSLEKICQTVREYAENYDK